MPATEAGRLWAPSRGTDRADRDALRFSAAMLFACLVLQRLGLDLGGKAFSLIGPIGIATAGVFLLRGTLAFDRFRLGCYVVLAACTLFGVAWHATTVDLSGEGTNLRSVAQFLLLTAFGTLTFAEPVDERRFFRSVNTWFAVIAVAGLLQFLAQFVGLRLFSFAGIVPDRLLYEFPYNLQIPLGVGDLLKSNGFFLVEPSVFSQLMALALAIEILAFRRPHLLALFVAGLMLSFSGTGWIVLGSFVLAATLAMGWRGLATAAVTLLVLGVLLGAGSMLVPDIAASLRDRTDEISRPGTSGHRRFVTPFWLLDDALTAEPSAALIGLGSGVSERLPMQYDYDVNTPIKIGLDYGFPALLAYVLMFCAGARSALQRAILVPAAATFFLAGNYTQFPPMLFLLQLLIGVAWLRQPDPAAR